MEEKMIHKVEGGVPEGQETIRGTQVDSETTF